jgi:hypothetical protein
VPGTGLTWSYPDSSLDGCGTSEDQMDDEWGYPHDKTETSNSGTTKTEDAEYQGGSLFYLKHYLDRVFELPCNWGIPILNLKKVV